MAKKKKEKQVFKKAQKRLLTKSRGYLRPRR